MEITLEMFKNALELEWRLSQAEEKKEEVKYNERNERIERD